jgi:diguanylate cyclase (GGDEF)-like protein
VSVLNVGAPRDDAPDPASLVTGQEWPVNDPPRREQSARPGGGGRIEGADAVREALIWWRWMRYAAAVVGMLEALFIYVGWVPGGGRNPLESWLPMATLSVAYLAWSITVAWFLEYASAETVPPKLPAAVVAGDLVALIGAVYLGSPPDAYWRLLVVGVLIVLHTVLYIGLRTSVWALAVLVVAYVTMSLFVPPYVPGPQQEVAPVVYDTILMLLVGGSVLHALGTFRRRLNALRRFCHDVELGELGGSLEPAAGGRADDLSMLARSIDEMRQRLIELIGTDPLTACLNRRALETRLAREWRHAKRRDAPLAVLAIDVDRFKPINDGYGHPFGDTVLQEIAEILKETARDTDAVARPGGDEFILILPDTGWQGATAFAERLRRNVDDHLFGGDRTSIQVTVSVGVAVARGWDSGVVNTGVGPAQLLEEADRSLYRAKSAGRNRISA